jgi:hypothetical protein
MKYSSFPVVALLVSTIGIQGLQEARTMRPGDTPEVCKGCRSALIRHFRRSLPRGERDARK